MATKSKVNTLRYSGYVANEGILTVLYNVADQLPEEIRKAYNLYTFNFLYVLESVRVPHLTSILQDRSSQ